MISHLSLNYLSPGRHRRRAQGAAALRELLALYVPIGDVGRGASRSRACARSRRSRRAPPAGARARSRSAAAWRSRSPSTSSRSRARSAFLLGACSTGSSRKYVSINAFTETVLRTRARRGDALADAHGQRRCCDGATLTCIASPRPRASCWRSLRRRRTASASIRRCGGSRRCIADRPRFGDALRPARGAGAARRRNPSLAFAPPRSPLGTTGRPRAGSRPARLLVHFFGLFGPNGPLPLHLTEYARDRRRNHATRPSRASLDLFHHRLLSLFYRAWANAQPTVSLDRPDAGPLRDSTSAR